MMKSTVHHRLEVAVPHIVRCTVMSGVDREIGDGLVGAIVATAPLDASNPRVGDRVVAGVKATSLCFERH